MPKTKIIVCVDMDAFFASVEQRDNPSLQGKPVAVIGSGERTIITTSSYEARAYGVKTGMTIYKAKKLCPQIIFVIGNNRKYAQICKKFEEICLRFTPDVEVYSIDEVFLDITGSYHLFNTPENLVKSIRKTVTDELGLTCTAGVGSNILIAKLASDQAKPDGFRWIREDMTASLLETLPVNKLWGIGSQTAEKLKAMGITTCGQLGRAPLSVLTKKFGVTGGRLKDMGNGKTDRQIEVRTQEPKSIGHSITLPKDIWQRDEIKRCLLMLSEKVGRRARRYGYEGQRIALTVRYNDFKTFSKQTTLLVHTNDTAEIYRSAIAILDSIKLTGSIRLLGISLSSLGKGMRQMSLFDEGSYRKSSAVNKALDTVNEKFGENTITFASVITEKTDHGVISPAWRPSGVRNSTS